MSIAAIVAEVQTKLAALYGSTVPCSVGMLKVDENDAPPRVVFVPTDMLYGPPKGPGREPRPLATHRQAFTVHCWDYDTQKRGPAFDFDAALALVLKVEAALLLTCSHFSASFQKGGWAKQNWAHMGMVGSPIVILDLPIVDGPLFPVTITSVHGTTGLQDSVEPGPSF
jgi:hypothetical protein